ncbi:MAG: protein kinase [Kofleriaceae bacterium]
MDEPAGTWILGEAIADGELAEVRAAVDATGRAAAVKRLHRHAARDPALRALFAAEIDRSLALPPHPRVVRGLDADPHGPRPYLACARVAGRDLRARLGVALRPAEVARLVGAAAAGVAHLHACGWVHGDVAPANLVGGDDGVVVCDLGVARRVGDGGAPRGTAAYMAPEQVRGLAWTPALDVFALAVVAWELSTGARLFHRGASYLSMAAVVEDAAPALADSPLAAVVAAALAKPPDDRPTLAELRAALDDVAARG